MTESSADSKCIVAMPASSHGCTAPDLEEIPLSVPELRGNEWVYLKECLDTNFVSSVGPFVERFERSTAERLGTRSAVATVNGTSALHVALLVAGVKPGDDVLMSTLTFIAPANAVRYTGAWPVFFDADPHYWQIDVQKIADFLATGCDWRDGAWWNRSTGRRVSAILPVDILGHPVDLDPLLEVARRYGLPVVEDASESLGARYRDRHVGAGADIACLSFNGNKVITTGGGGMILTDNEAWATRCRYLTTTAKDDPLEFIHGAVGFNYRLTNVLAALGVAQLERLDEFVATKRRIADAYAEGLREVPGIRLMAEAPWATSAFWLYTIQVDRSEYGSDSRDVLRMLAKEGIQARPLWQPAHQSPAHQAPHNTTGCPVAERLNRTSLSLPSSVGLTSRQQARVIAAIRNGARA